MHKYFVTAPSQTFTFMFLCIVEHPNCKLGSFKWVFHFLMEAPTNRTRISTPPKKMQMIRWPLICHFSLTWKKKPANGWQISLQGGPGISVEKRILLSSVSVWFLFFILTSPLAYHLYCQRLNCGHENKRAWATYFDHRTHWPFILIPVNKNL
jgi:hypothetical protein